ncbi:MAG: DinB family protein [Chloroflexi bacterium]|nr:DinB family protein [Chloroflexota bacterium]MDA1003546.1 DinB family protein [Chloroflexota bacterium]
MTRDAPDRVALIEDHRRAREGLRQALELVARGWERTPVPRSADDEPWSPRQASEHAIATEFAFMGMIARAIEIPPPPRIQPLLADPDAALRALAAAAEEAERVLGAVSDDQLEIEVEFAASVAGLMRFAAGHLREHARQVAGIR